MNRSAKKQLHEQQRKRHKQEAKEHARELAKRGRSKTPMWLLVLGIVIIFAAVAAMSFR